MTSLSRPLFFRGIKWAHRGLFFILVLVLTEEPAMVFYSRVGLLRLDSAQVVPWPEVGGTPFPDSSRVRCGRVGRPWDLNGFHGYNWVSLLVVLGPRSENTWFFEKAWFCGLHGWTMDGWLGSSEVLRVDPQRGWHR